eukprot:gene10120-21089_t
MSASIINRQGDASKRVKAHKNLAEIGDLKSQYNASKARVAMLEDVLQKELEKRNSVQQHFNEMSDELARVQEDIDMTPLPEGALPTCKQLELAVASQTQNVEKAKKSLRDAERKLFESDKNVNQFVDALEETGVSLAAQAVLDKERSDRLARYEIKRAKKWEKEQKEAVDAQAGRVKQYHDLAQHQIDQTRHLHNNASQNLQMSNNETIEINKKIQDMKEEEISNRIESILELKTNQDAVRVQVAAQAAKYIRKVQLAKQKLEDEKSEMLAEGLNPYAEFRKRELDAAANATERRLKKAVEDNKADVAARMLKEEELFRKDE